MARSLQDKLAILADAAKYDASCASSGSQAKRKGDGVGSTEGMGICHSYTPDGRCVSLLKILLTNYCIYDCKFCINRISSSVPRARFKPDEVVRLTLDFYKRNYIEGLFLSSGIIQNPDYTMEQIVEVARKLREENGFRGYIHLKTIPGAADDLLLQAGRYADRLSVNIELPTEDDLLLLAPEKNQASLEQNMAVVENKIQELREPTRGRALPPVFTPAGQSTQMVVGATPTADREVLLTASRLYKGYGLRRVYYSAFSPIPDAHSQLPLQQPPLLREHRLYQSDWLIRFYQYEVNELLPAARPSLRLDVDPKTAWALENRDFFPVDVNHASREALLRVPGLGVRTVERVLEQRRHRTVRWNDLRRLRAAVDRARPFLITADGGPPRWADKDELLRRVLPSGEQLHLAF
ncbi:MAG: putative DNA modification/repair radical SAM protein [Vulcanimicrobiota bacterium]